MTDESVSFSFGKCRICTGKAMGVHYGTATCEGCKAFFKRWMDRDKTLACYFGGNCVITPDTRHCCKGCRFRKCKENGMSIEAIKMGRIPKIEKTAAIEDFKRSKKETKTPNSVKENRPQKKKYNNADSQGINQDTDHSSTLNPDHQETVEMSEWSPLGQSSFSSLDGVFNGGQLPIIVLENDSATLQNDHSVEAVIFPYDARTNHSDKTSNHQEASVSFHGQQTLLADQNSTADDICQNSAGQSNFTRGMLGSDRTETDSGPTSINERSKTQHMLVENTADLPASQNYLSQCKQPRLSEISPKIITSVDHQITETPDNYHIDGNESTGDECPNTADKHRNYIDKAIMDSIGMIVDGPEVYDTTELHESTKDMQTGAEVSEIYEIARDSSHLHNYVRLLTTLSENESLGNELGNQSDLSIGNHPGDHWSMDSILSIGETSAESTAESDRVNDSLAFEDIPHVQTVYIPDSRFPNIGTGTSGKDTTRGVPSSNQPEVQGDSREFVKSHHPIADNVTLQHDRDLTTEPLQPEQLAHNKTNQNGNQNFEPGNNVQFKVLSPVRMSHLATAIFVNLNGSNDPSDDGIPNNITDTYTYRNHSNRASNAGIDNEHASSNRDETNADTGRDIMGIMRKTMKVFHRSVDKLYIPIFLKRRIAMKHRHRKKGQKIATRSKEGVGYLLAKFLREIKVENERITGFALEMPGFPGLCTDDQMLLLKRAFIEIYLLTASKESNDEWLYIGDNAPVLNQAALNALVDDKLVDQINRLHELLERFGLSHLEIGLLCAIQLTSLDGISVEDASSIEALHSHYLDVFSYMVYSSQRDNKARMVVEIFFNLIPVLKSLSGSVNRFMESAFLEENAEHLFKNLL
ncbi:uncharacterized protein LOC117316533 [Pecten maximus]|uniref:uncharacterized protein LOC117316533 n=1 Tax=Pecten maximus TaxID=6579 RepID=UPI0014583E59|nr:uncharacterized protein LOC117316533 [Pecten maximus]